MKHLKTIFAILSMAAIPFTSAKTVTVKPSGKDDTKRIQKVIDKLTKKEPVTLVFAPGKYNISRENATPRVIYVSNTSRKYQVDIPVKHIGMLFEGFNNLTVDATGAEFTTFGEMTPWVVSDCRNTVIKGLTIDADDPSVTEMTITEASEDAFTAVAEPKSKYEIRDGRIFWVGHGWEFDKGHSQFCDTVEMITKNIKCPLNSYTSVTETAPRTLRFEFNEPYPVKEGWTIQMRHTIRNEVGGLILNSTGTRLEDIDIRFIGNFGIVGQNSSDIAFHRVNFKPSEGRTNCGFADYIHISGCSGLIDFEKCNFRGSQDDPINVHGTAMKVDKIEGNKLRLSYGHPETYGFPVFAAGDSIELIDRNTLLPVFSSVVTEASLDGENAMDITLSDTPSPRDGLVIENVTATPEVRVSGCRFELTPTRGILVTTRRPVVIENNTFLNTPMPAILIADDARSWFESGRVQDVTISGNTFIGCGHPTVSIAPEVSGSNLPVHSNIRIIGNVFHGKSGIAARNTEGLKIIGNRFEFPPVFNFNTCENIILKQE